jgi:probable rRNA maturation factor
MIYIESQLDLPLDPALLENAARLTLAYAQAEAEAELTLVVGDDSLLQHYNHQYLGIDAPTDVLSFPAEYTDPDTQAHYLGDVLISLPRAQAQAASGGRPLLEELQLLVVHGVLHLLGHDHSEVDETARMQNAQDAIMNLLGSHNSPRLGLILDPPAG